MLETDILITKAGESLALVSTYAQLNQLKAKYIGKSGEVTKLLKSLGKLPPEQRPAKGKEINDAKERITQMCHTRLAELNTLALNQSLKAATIDVSLKAKQRPKGSLHPITHATQEICEIFKQVGFSVVQGPEIETENYNFDALNIPGHHPARAMHDTFYFQTGYLLRTHTSPVQIRTLEHEKPPIRIIAPGRVYRCDADKTHSPMFHQIEGLLLDDKTNLADLKHMLKEFLHTFFDTEDLDLRFRSSYFPFTEPSLEVDIAFKNELGKNQWMEVLGCGMVHPNVLKNVNIDPNKIQGYAFGLGVERLCMLKYKIPDIRLLFENDIQFLQQF